MVLLIYVWVLRGFLLIMCDFADMLVLRGVLLIMCEFADIRVGFKRCSVNHV